MKRILAVVLVLLGVAGLVAGRLGETVWAPPTERTASVTLEDPGPAVLLDPGLLYVGGTQGTARISGDGDLTMITASNDDIRSYLEGTRYTRVTGLSDWSTLTTETVDPEGETALPENVENADIWRTVETEPSPVTIDIEAFATEEMETNPQPYRALLFITDGEKAGATTVDITWPVEDHNEWVPYAYAGGAAVAVIGLVLLVVSLSGRRRDDEGDVHEQDRPARAATDSTVPAAGGVDAVFGDDQAHEEHNAWGNEHPVASPEGQDEHASDDTAHEEHPVASEDEQAPSEHTTDGTAEDDGGHRSEENER